MKVAQVVKEKIYSLLDHFQDGIFVIESGLMIYANRRLQEMLEYPLSEIIGQPFTHFVYEADRHLVESNYAKRQNGEPIPNEYQFRLITQSGTILNVQVSVGVTMYDNQPISIGTLHDITERLQTKHELKKSQCDIDSILHNMPDVFYRTDSEGYITMISPSCEDALGYRSDEMVGHKLTEFYCNVNDRQPILDQLVAADGKAVQVQSCLKHKNGSSQWISTNAYIRYNENREMVAIEGIARNITEQKELEQRLLELAQIDDLTQICNRRHFLKQSQKLVHIARRYDRPIALLMIDLDSFKIVNDTYGHAVGDEVLRHFAVCCQPHLRQTDIFGRLGGEEFAIIAPESDQHAAMQLAERIRQTVNSCNLNIEGNALQYTVSIGIAVLDSSSEASIEGLLKQADTALYRAKEQRNCSELFSC